MEALKPFILSEIRRLSDLNGGVAPGQGAFAKATGITPGKWRGVLWLRWSDALSEAGLDAQQWNGKFDSDDVLRSIAELTLELRRLPTKAEIKMRRTTHRDFPSHSTVYNHFRTNADLIAAMADLASSDEVWSDLSGLLPTKITTSSPPRTKAKEGFVYLLKSGQHYKVGRSDNVERRLREVKVSLPEAVTLIHAIRTDDPVGIEAYWHRRFADKRANGEWFSLTGDDVRAFQRRTYQ